MTRFLLSYFANSILTSLVILTLLLLQPFLRKHFSTKCLYQAWLIILLALLIPFRPSFSNSFVSIDLPRTSIEASEEAIPSLSSDFLNFETSKATKDKNHTSHSSTPNTYLIPEFGPLQSEVTTLNLIPLLAIVWLIGSILKTLYLLLNDQRFKQKLKRFSQPVTDSETLHCFHSIQQKCKLSTKTHLYRCSFIQSPMAVGLIHPVIYFPTREYKSEEQKLLLEHECIHIKRKDYLPKLLTFLVCSIHWFNPLVSVMARKLNELCEITCDEVVLRNSTKEERFYYSHLLLKIASDHTISQAILLSNFYGGKQSMKLRLQHILDTKRKRSGLFFLTLFAMILFTTSVFTVKATQTNQIDTESEVTDDTVVSSLDSNQDSTAEATLNQDTTSNQVTPEESTSNPSTSLEDKESDTNVAINETVLTEDTDTVTNEAMETDASSSIAEYANSLVDEAYIYGGTSPETGFDSSGFVQYVFQQFGIELPRTSALQCETALIVSVSDLQPGDVVFYGNDNQVNHVAIYLGDNQVIHASNPSDGVKLSTLDYRPVISYGRFQF